MIIQMTANSTDIDTAIREIRRGGLVAFPTETVYGLGADATSDTAVARIFEAKGRPSFNPLIIHVPDLAAAEALVAFNPLARLLAAAFWPGPLTIVLPRLPDCPVSLLAGAGLDTLGVRVPAHAIALDLLKGVGKPLAAPSANRSGKLSPTLADHVWRELGSRVDFILDGGPCAVGLESTIVDLSRERPILLRPGGLSLASIGEIIGPIIPFAAAPGEAPRAPGMLASHYAPDLPIRLNATERRPGEAFVAFGRSGVVAPEAQLSEAGDTVEAAAKLFAVLRSLDRPPYTAIAVMPIPERGLGPAIGDRLRRAAAGRA